MLGRLRADGERSLYLFDVRDPAEYHAGHVAGTISAPGGVQNFQNARIFFEVGLARHAALNATQEDIEAFAEALPIESSVIGTEAAALSQGTRSR